MSASRDVTDDTFATEVLGSERPVLVDFWAQWCGPCHQVAPVLDEIAAEHAGTMDVVRLNVDENPVTAARYGVLSLPTLNVYAGGEVVRSIVGAKPKRRLLEDLEGII